MQDFKSEEFKVTRRIKLADIDTEYRKNYDDDVKEEKLVDTSRKLAKIQEKMYANNRYAALICLQGMDTSGKDSLIRELFKQFNPRGVVIHSFKVPSSTELEHDYLWRHYVVLPEKGKVAVFNRTHYENVLVTRVHPEYLLGENLPGIEKVEDVTPEFWENRFRQINNFEQHIAQNGTIVLKFYLHMSKEEQRKRLLRRLEEEDHNWKFSPGDLKERACWEQYMACYEEAISETSKPHAPWFVVPADDKELCRCIIADILLEELSKYDFPLPDLEDKVEDNIEMYRKQLENE
ncbi:Polyphosphate kinase-2-related domain-containing protein [Flavobacterium longum]|uniref:PPK2 family polyphosphate kinase n=1 Tax=Flavobacterium longum TaxID=1299340 RepID=UPI0039E85196